MTSDEQLRARHAKSMAEASEARDLADRLRTQSMLFGGFLGGLYRWVADYLDRAFGQAERKAQEAARGTYERPRTPTGTGE